MSTETVEETTIEELAVQTTDQSIVDDKSTEDKTGAAADKAGEMPSNEADKIEDEVVVTIGDEAPPQEDKEIAEAPKWVKDLRQSQRELTRKNKELERQLAAQSQSTEQVALGAKPKMSDPEIDYDAAKFEDSLTKWNDKKRIVDSETAQRQATEKKSQEAWQQRLTDYGMSKTQLKVKDFAECETTVSESLNVTQQGIIIQGSDNAAIVIYALGKNSTKLKELTAITDPVKFAFAVAKLEKDLKVTTRKAPPPPEQTVSGSAPKSGVVDSQLEKLRAEAERTGDYSKVTKYKRDKRQAS